jgi:hypothetical protein
MTVIGTRASEYHVRVVHPWTVDDRWEMWIVSFFGADGFFTNRPDLALLFYGRADHVDLKPMWERIGN